MAKRISAVFFLLVIFSVSAWLCLRLPGAREELALSPAAVADGSYFARLEDYVRAHIPARERLERFSIALQRAGGTVQIGDIILGDGMLMTNLAPPDEEAVVRNTEAILDFADRVDIPSYAMLIPTACAIKQQALPDNITLFNQKHFIEQVYAGFEGSLSVVNSYPQLLAGQEDYIYYRTSDNLTAKGGQLLYQVLGKRLGFSPLRPLEQFDISYADERFYGELYEQVPCKGVEPDRATYYRFTRYRREYMVTHYDAQGGVRTYYSLFPQFLQDLPGAGHEVVLGGISPVIDIRSTTGDGGELLIFGDETALSYIPFLLVHYSRITLVDVAAATPEQFDALPLEDYQQILFGVSVDTFMHTDAFTKLEGLMPDW